MPLTDLFLKIQVEHDQDERPEAVAEEICRTILKRYGVRSAELSSYSTREE